MYKIEEAVIVEGNYDKIKLSGFGDGLILTTGGFSVFNDKKLQQSIVTLSKKTGIVILTDSDSAGIKIRNFVKQIAKDGRVIHAYIPEIEGKERRKRVAGKEGLLGVEGIDEETILKALTACGCSVSGKKSEKRAEKEITKTDFYNLGLSGSENSETLRKHLAKKLELPSKLSANMLLEAVNKLMTLDELKNTVEKIKNL